MENLIKVLKAHDVEYTIVSNRVLADETDITDYTMDDLSLWLGY